MSEAMQVCNSCHIDKHLTEFTKRREELTGYGKVCKQCRREHHQMRKAEGLHVDGRAPIPPDDVFPMPTWPINPEELGGRVTRTPDQMGRAVPIFAPWARG